MSSVVAETSRAPGSRIASARVLPAASKQAAPKPPMLGQHYLSLRPVRLGEREEWSHQGEGLAFIFVKSGSGRFSTGPVQQNLVAGDVLVLGAGSNGVLGAAHGSELILLCFTICIDHLFPLFASDEIWLLRSLAEHFKRAKVYSACAAVATECHKLLADAPPHFNFDHRSHLLRVASIILSVEFRSARHQQNAFRGTDERVSQILEQLSVDEILDLSVEELAERFGCSRRHLNRLFQQKFGVPVATLKMEMRMLKAISLLRDPDAKVIHVAEQCSFNHLGLFNTCFKRRFGVSPSQWRKQASDAAAAAAPQAGTTKENPVYRLLNDSLCQFRTKAVNRHVNTVREMHAREAA
jgi:AraC-like DNA-binding protein